MHLPLVLMCLFVFVCAHMAPPPKLDRVQLRVSEASSEVEEAAAEPAAE